MTAPTLLDQVEEYLALRRGLGFGLQTLEGRLVDFARYAERARHQGPVTIDLAVQWALGSRSSAGSYAAQRLSAVRQFARHLAVADPRTEIPPAGLLGRAPARRSPHIYTDTELAALLHQTHLLHPLEGLRPKTYTTVFSLLGQTTE